MSTDLLIAHIRQLVRTRGEWLLLALLLLSCFLLPRGLPLGVGGLGLVSGAAVSIQALGIVLVYRSNKVINFAQFQAGTTGALLFTELVNHQSFLILGHNLCGACVPVAKQTVGDSSYSFPVGMPAWTVQLNFWLSLLCGLALALVLMMALFLTMHLRRLADAPRLIATVFTLGAGQVFTLVGVLVADVFPRMAPGAIGGAVSFPFSWRVRLGSINFGASDVLTIAALAIALGVLGFYLNRTLAGSLLRGAADNPARARSLGVNTTTLNARAWMAAGLLSGIGATLAATSSAGAASAVGTVPMLAAAVVGSFTAVGLTVAAALVFGILSSAALWSFNSTASVDVAFLVVIIVALLAQRGRAERADRADQGWNQIVDQRPIPAELRRLEPVDRWIRTLRLLIPALMLGLPWLLSPAQLTLTIIVVLYGMIALSLLVLTGWAGQISLGQMGIAAVGGYVAAILNLPFPLPVLAGGLAASVAALAVGLPALRLRGMHLAVTTIAFNFAVVSLLLNPSALGSHLPNDIRPPSFLGLNLSSGRTFYYLALVVLGLVFLATVGMRRSRIGRALIACRDNEALAQAYAINLTKTRLSVFMVSGFMAGIAGGLYAFAASGVNPSNFGPAQSIYLFVLAVIGGLGATVGPLLGALFIGSTMVFSSNHLVALGATGFGLVAVILFAPGGLAQVMFGIRDAMLRRVAERYKVDAPSLFFDRSPQRDKRVPISAKARAGGGQEFVPVRYVPQGQWGIARLQRERERV